MAATKKLRPRKTSRPNFRVRKATLKDLNSLVQQRRAMWNDLGVTNKRDLDEADKVYARWARSRMKRGLLLGWVAENHGNIIGGGCVLLQSIQPRPGYNKMVRPYLLSMYTEPGSRGSGVASAIVEKAVEWCRKNQFSQLALHASEMGRKVYLKHGFKRTWEMRLRIKELAEDD